MYEHFTEAAISTIIRAQEESRQAGHNFVAPEQLLLGLLSGGRGLAFKALTQANVTLVAARTEVLNIEPKGSDRIAMEIPFTPASKRILELSLVAALEKQRLIKPAYTAKQQAQRWTAAAKLALSDFAYCDIAAPLP